MDEFLNLEAKEVERWISSDEISVAVEADVFQDHIKVDRTKTKASEKHRLNNCFVTLRLAFLSREFLWDVVTNEARARRILDCFKAGSPKL